MNAMSDEAIIQSESSVQTKWWVAPAINRDAYELYVARYHTEPDGLHWGEYLDRRGSWHRATAGDYILPTLEFPGVLVHTLSSLGVLQREEIAGALRTLAGQIMAAESEGG